MYEQPGPQVPPAPYAVPGPPPRRTGRTVAIVVAAVLLLCCCGGGLFAALKPDALGGFAKDIVDAVNSDVANAELGDCVNDFAQVEDARVVDCASTDAANKVVGVVEDVRESEFDTKQQTLCEAYPTWEQIVWIGRKGGNGDVWCLAPLKS
ncbi:LppU/SCO3897 family protein [Catellatospora citrea]|uniref:Uncharacterized protein n=1 Tax=Catellatospora citrea TaxID=53366 RepID=A0A8J3KGJ7_9ACTN|nr:hypothetical protein [Catellatospora citrea]RKE08132.1 hypothetical protein C8E86_2976 [Catellatospora citrea]GIF98513.1 hypothetical protein Cci01nite_36070 [Catellatospora citrea]